MVEGEIDVLSTCCPLEQPSRSLILGVPLIGGTNIVPSSIPGIFGDNLGSIVLQKYYWSVANGGKSVMFGHWGVSFLNC